MFSFEFSDYQDSDAKEKNNDFLVGYLYSSIVFSIDILMKGIERVMAEK